MVKAAFHVREDSSQGGGAVRIVGRAIGLEIVYADLGCLVRIPTRLRKERRHVTSSAVCLALEQHFSTSRCCPVETTFWWRGRRDRKLIKLQCCQFRGDHIICTTFVSEASASCHRVFLCVVQARVEERSLPLQLEVANEGVPVSGQPQPPPGVKDTGIPAESGWRQAYHPGETLFHPGSTPRRIFPDPNWQAPS